MAIFALISLFFVYKIRTQEKSDRVLVLASLSLVYVYHVAVNFEFSTL